MTFEHLFLGKDSCFEFYFHRCDRTGLRHHKLFDDKMIALVKVAEETNQTEFIFERLNIQYNIQVQQQSKLMSTIMEPVMILFVGVVLIAMYLPMFKLSSVLGEDF